MIKPESSQHNTDVSHLRSTLHTIALLVGISGTVLAPLVYLSSTKGLRDTIITVLVAVIGWISVWLIRRGYLTYIPHIMVYSLLTVSGLEMLAFGSVRAAMGYVTVATVAGAGVFLGRRALIGTVVYSAVSLGLLIVAEVNGWLPPADQRVGLKVWLIYCTVLIAVAILVFYSRSRAEDAFKRQLEEQALRKKTELQRRLSDERFARIFRNSPSPMLAQSAMSGAILDVNPAFERCYGYSRDQVLGRIDTFLWAHANEREPYREQLIAHRRYFRQQVTSLRADGNTFEVQVSSELGDDPRDRLVITTVIDISAHVDAMEQLRRSEDRFAKAFNFSPLNMTISRLIDGKFIEVNPTGDQIQGMSPDEIKGKTALEVGAWINGDDRARFVERLRRDGYVHAYDTQMLHRVKGLQNSRVWAEMIEIDGEECVLACRMNVTEEKRREAVLTSIAQGMNAHSSEAFFTELTRHMATALDADKVLMGEMHSNQQVSVLSVWQDGQSRNNCNDPSGELFCMHTPDQTGLCVFNQDLPPSVSGKTAEQNQGFETWVEQVLRDDRGKPIGRLKALWRRPVHPTPELRALMSIFASRASAELLRLQRDREILRLNETLEQRVRERTAELEKLNAELDNFAYSVSHDLKSPLRAIDGYTQLLSEQFEGRMDAEEQRMLSRILGATHRMATLMADLLALARVSQESMVFEEIDLSGMAERTLRKICQRAPRQNLRWQIEPGLQTRCDARLTSLALKNLLENAVKYTRDQASPLIEVGLFSPGSESGLAPVFYVRDNGIGFSMKHANLLFKPFQRLHMPSAGYEGTGIGLATVRRIVERHGGFITGTASPGQGAEFQFTLAQETKPKPAAP